MADSLLLAALARALVATVLEEVRAGRPTSAWRLLRRLVELVTPALDRHGDLATVTLQLGRLRAHGTGATRQRAVAERGGVLAVLPHLARLTRG